MACSDDTMDDFWNFILNESEEDSCRGRRQWFTRNKVHTSERDFYSDRGGENGEESYTETLESKIERAFDAVFYEKPKKERPRRFNWFRQKYDTKPEENDFFGGTTIFAPSLPAAGGRNRGLTSNMSWFSAQDERNESQELRKAFKRDISQIFAPDLSRSASSHDRGWFAG